MLTQPAVISQIEPNIYIGNCIAATNITVLRMSKITHILVCGSGLPCPYKDDFKYKQLNIEDTSSYKIIDLFDETNSFIRDAINSNGVVFIHCAMGISRSVCILTAYLIKFQQISSEEAIKYIQSKHERANPNSGFRKQLKNYEKLLKRVDNIQSGICGCLII